MAEKLNLSVMIDEIIRDVTIRVAKLDLYSFEPEGCILEGGVAIVTTITGHYVGNIVLTSDLRVIRGISENMKHEQITQESEIEIYAVEFFNILCGRIITAISNRSRLSARFNIPLLLPGVSEAKPTEDGITRYEWCYGSRCGPMRIRMGLKRA